MLIQFITLTTLVTATAGLFSYEPYRCRMSGNQLEADIIVVGGGAAGCILMSELSENGQYSVLGIEGGPNLSNDPVIEQVGLSAFLLAGPREAKYFGPGWAQSLPMPGLNGRTSDWTTGMLLGGGASVNGLYYGRGSNAVSRWKGVFGSRNWSLNNILATFKAVENTHNQPQVTASSETTKLTGRIARPSSELYESSRLGWDKYFSTYPAVIVFVQNTDDVLNAVRWSRETGTALRIRSGGHCLEGWNSVDGGIVINVSDLKSIKIDKQKMTVTIGTGVTQSDLWEALEGTGLGFPCGDEGQVGSAGVILGGGIGMFAPKWGVVCDSLLAVEMVVANESAGAKVVHADLNQNSDLLWACRGGGGGNFGVATSFTLQLHPIPDTIVVWKINWRFDSLHNAFEAWQSWVSTTDDRLGSTFNVVPPGSTEIADTELEVSGIFLGTEAELGDLLSPLTRVEAAKVQTVSQSFLQRYRAINSVPNNSLYWQFKGAWSYQKMSKEALDIVTQFLINSPTKDSSFWALGWGGKVRVPPKGGSAFFHRQPLFYSEPGVGWSDRQQNGLCMAWATEFRMALSPYVAGGYVNVPDTALANWEEAYYGSNFKRLRKIKSKWDPYNIFKFEQSIPCN